MGYENVNSKKKHLDWIDLIRCFAICTVILIHVLQDTYSYELNILPYAGTGKQFVELGLFTIGRLGVPLFVLVSGFLLLDREYNVARTKKFWTRNVFGIFLASEIWIVIYNLFLAWYSGESVVGWKLFQNMFFLREVDFTHNPVWYLPMILGLYIFIPYVANALQSVNEKLLIFPFSIVLAYLYVLPVVNIVREAMLLEPLTRLPGLEFGGGTYGVLLIIGYLKKKGAFEKIATIVLYAIGIVSFGVLVGIEIFCYEHQVAYQVWYNCIFILITAICIFEIISRWNQIPCKKIVRSLATCSFGIYLIHKPILMVIQRYVVIERNSVQLVVTCILTLVISWGAVWLLNKVPKLGRILFFIR